MIPSRESDSGPPEEYEDNPCDTCIPKSSASCQECKDNPLREDEDENN